MSGYTYYLFTSPLSLRYKLFNLRDLHSRIKIEKLLHQFIRREGSRHHRYGSDVIDTHAAVQAFHNAVLVVNVRKSFEHANAARKCHIVVFSMAFQFDSQVLNT